MVGRLLSFWEGNFSGAMLNFGRENPPLEMLFSSHPIELMIGNGLIHNILVHAYREGCQQFDVGIHKNEYFNHQNSEKQI